MSGFETIQQEEHSNTANETDDIFEEIIEHKIKSENEKHEQYIGNNIFDISFEGNIEDNSSSDIKCLIVEDITDDSYNVNEQPYNSKNAKHKYAITLKSLNEDADDVFDEEREKKEKQLVIRNIYFDNLATQIKTEAVEHNDIDDTSNLEENLDLLTNIKEENDEICSVHAEEKIKIESGTESEELRDNLDYYTKHPFEAEIGNRANTELSVGMSSANGDNILNKSPDSTSQHLSVEVNGVNSVTVVAITGDCGKLQKETDYFNKKFRHECTDEKNKQEKEINEKCDYVNVKEFEKDSNVQEKLNGHPKELSANVEFKNVDVEKKLEESKEKKLVSRKRNIDINEKLDGKEKKVNCRGHTRRNIFIDVDKVQTNNEPSAIKENSEVAVSENTEKIQIEIDSTETTSKRKDQKNCKRFSDRSSQTHVEDLPEISIETPSTYKDHENCKIFLDRSSQTDVQNLLEISTETTNTDKEYICTQCLVKAKYKADLNKSVNGLEFCATISSCLDIIEKAKLYTSQLEKVYHEKQLQLQIIIRNNQLEKENVSKEIVSKNLNSDILSGTTLKSRNNEGLLDTFDKAVCPQNEEKCAQTPQDIQINKNYTDNSINEKASEDSFKIALDHGVIENQNISLNENNSSECNQDTMEEAISNDSPTKNVEYTCTKCPFKTKCSVALMRHLKTHGIGVSSGIISFLDLENSQSNNFEASSSRKNEIIDVIDESRVTIEEYCEATEETEGTLFTNRNILATCVGSKSKDLENTITKIGSTNKVKLELGTRSKRKKVNRSLSPRKEVKLEVKNMKMYCCDECSYKSYLKKNLNSHKIVHSKDVIKCNHCDFSTNHQRNLNAHMLIHLKPEEVKMRKCPHCPYQTKRNGDLHMHMVLHKKAEELKMFQCNKCSYQTKRKGNLRIHQVRHKSAEELTLFDCAVCSFKAKTKATLKTHMIIHQRMEDICWFKCEQCTYRTKYKSSLTKHSKVHKGHDEIKTFDCPECSYRAKHKWHLKQHLLRHKNPKDVKMHRCNYCSYKTIQKSNLLVHMTRHKKIGEIKMLKCSQCPYEAKFKSTLHKHVKHVHSSS